MKDEIVSVGEFVALLNQTLSYAYPAIRVEGEVSGYSGPNRNGHHYLTLKDDEAQIKAVAFRGTVDVPLEDGMKVIITGSPNHHPQYGFSFIVRSLVPSGEGAIKRAMELLKKKLDGEGLFAPDRKREIPAIPQRIGVVSSAQAAGYADFIKILDARWSGVEVLLADVQVQGEPAAGQIVKAIEYFNQMAETVDVLVITRGGGSLEDLQAFSQESVVRAVAGSRIPTIVAVGHEVDISLADLAADVRAATPSDAARLIVPDKREFIASLEQQRLRVERSLIGRLDELSYRLERHASQMARFVSRPLEQIQNLKHDIQRSVEGLLEQREQQRQALKKLLTSYNPRDVLRRGYAIVSHENRAIRSVESVSLGDSLMLELSDGQIDTEVKSVKKDK